MTPAEFFREIFGEGAPGYLPLWCRQSKATVWLPANDLDAIGYEAEKLSQTDDVYFGACLQEQPLGPNRRGGAQSAIAMGGVWGDIDIAGPGHKDTALPPDMEAAVKLACSMSDLPSAVVDTGGGIHAWWLFDKLWVFNDTADRLAAQELVRAHQAGLRSIAARNGWKVDATHDLARVLRVPGTMNRKLAEARPVSMARRAGGRFPRGDLKVIAPPPSYTFEEATSLYNSTHTYGWPKSGGTCPVCLHRECFGRMADQPDRWVCFSANHGTVGVAGSGCYHGDSLDIDAHTRRLSRADLLRESGLLAPGAYVPPDPVPDPVAAPASKLTVVPFGDVAVDFSRPMLVEDLIGHGSFVLGYGAPGSGKSFLFLDLALHVAMGWSWFGRSIAQGAVVYVAAEAPHSIACRMLAMRLHHSRVDPASVPLFLMPHPIDLLNGDIDTDAVIAKVLEVAGGTVSLVIVDTLARTMPGGEENESRTMSLLTARLDKIRAGTNATVLVVHHSGKTENKGARGHSSIQGAADTIIEVRRQQGADTRTAFFEKVKDGEDGVTVGFELCQVQVGTTSAGKARTSAFVVHLSDEQAKKPPEGRNKEALLVLSRMILATPDGVTVADWRAEFAAGCGLSPRNARDTFNRALKSLAAWVSVRGEIVTLRSKNATNGKVLQTPPCRTKTAILDRRVRQVCNQPQEPKRQRATTCDKWRCRRLRRWHATMRHHPLGVSQLSHHRPRRRKTTTKPRPGCAASDQRRSQPHAPNRRLRSPVSRARSTRRTSRRPSRARSSTAVAEMPQS